MSKKSQVDKNEKAVDIVEANAAPGAESVPLTEDDARTVDVINNQIIMARLQLGEVREAYARQEANILNAISQKSNEMNSMAQTLATKNKLDLSSGKWTLSLKDKAFVRQKSVH